MPDRTHFHLLRLVRLLALLTIGFALVPSASAQTVKSSGKLSQRLTTLLQVNTTRMSRTEVATVLSLPEQGAGSLQWRADGALLVNIQLHDFSSATLDALQAAGATIQFTAADAQRVLAYVQPTQLSLLARNSAVAGMSEATQYALRNDGSVGLTAPVRTNLAATCPTGVISEGDQALKANLARSNFGLSGSGVKIGVISDSYDVDSSAPTHAANDILNGDLPGTNNTCGHTTPIQVLAEGDPTRGTDEGRAMLQIVHDLAPGAQLLFAAAGGSPDETAANIRKLANAGAQVIVDDIFWPGYEPFFQDGVINVAIEEVSAKGVVYLAAAGNANIYDSNNNNISSYEAASYRPTTCPSALNALTKESKPLDCHNFAVSGAADPTFGMTLGSGGYLLPELQWAEPLYGIKTDFDLYLIDTTSNKIVSASAKDSLDKSTPPFEMLSYVGSGNYALVIGRFAGTATPRLKFVFQGANNIVSTEYNATNNKTDTFGPSVGDHVATASAIGVAALYQGDLTRPESYSSFGPATHYYGPVNGTTPANALGSPKILNKPEVAAVDGTVNSFFGTSSSPYRFYGTSAAAPHAAAAVALLRERATQLGVPFNAGIATAALQRGAAPIAHGSAASTGAGLIDVQASATLLEQFERRVFAPLLNR